MNRPSMQIGLGIVLGIGIGTGVAMFLGSGGLWLAIGVALGVALGAAMFRKTSHKHDERITTND